MKVGQIVYPYIQQGRAKVQVYISYTLGSPTTWPEGRTNVVDTLKNEKLIPYHVCSDVVYSETCHYADLLLPDATYLERWGLETRNNYELRPFVAMRQPMTNPPGDCQSFADTLFELGRRLRPEVSKYFQFGKHENYVKAQCANVPKGDCQDGFEFLKKHGVYTDLTVPPSYEIYRRVIAKAQLENTRTDELSGVVYANTEKGEVPIGFRSGEKVYRGFKTPSRRFEIRVQDVIDAGRKVGFEDDGMPRYVPIPAHQNLKSEDYILTTFKWNVHTQARTAPQKYLSEIAHDNPAWINASTAKKLGVSTGDTIEITTFRPTGHTFQPSGDKLGSAKIKVFVTEGIHPRVIAVSNSVGHLFGGRGATGEEGPPIKHAGYGNPEDDDLSYSLWWDERKGGKGNGTNINAILPINPAPLVGMQAWFDNVCHIRKV